MTERLIVDDDYKWVDTTIGMCLEIEDVFDLVNELDKETQKIKKILFDKREELNNAYNQGVKAGMPTGGVIGELDLIEEIIEEMEWD